MVSESNVISIHEIRTVHNNLFSPYSIFYSIPEHNYNLFLQVQETISKSL